MKSQKYKRFFGVTFFLTIAIQIIWFLPFIFSSHDTLNPLLKIFSMIMARVLIAPLESPFLFEIATLIILPILGIWLIYFLKKEGKSFIFPIFLAILLGHILFYYGFILILFSINVSGASKYTVRRTNEFQAKQQLFLPLITTLADKAERINVRSDIDTIYSAEFSYGGGRIPIYFIRLKDNKIQKLFQSGDTKTETIDTPGERKIVQMLQGKRSTLEFPQYTCCGGDDIWSETPFLRHLLPGRRYLKDFHSELEIIILLHDSSGDIQGAMVLLHGD